MKNQSRHRTGRVRFLVLPHTHWDREWYLPLEHFRFRLCRLVDGLIEALERDPGFGPFHFDGQTIVLEDYAEAGLQSDRLRGLVREGRIKVGPWFVLPDEFLVSGESLIRNLERGFRVCREWGTRPVMVGYLPDMFGHIAQMPQILRGFGLEQAVAWRGAPLAAGRGRFKWRAPDGSVVTVAFLCRGYGFASHLPHDPALLVERLESLLEEIGLDGEEFVLFNGSDHVEPDPGLAAALDRAMKLRPGWSWEFTDLEGWLPRLSASGPDPATVAGELRSSEQSLILPGTASARLYLKERDFMNACRLECEAEPLSALARALGGPDFSGFLDYAWRLLLENHPHDSICGCSVDEVHDEMETRSAKTGQVLDRVIKESLGEVMKNRGDRSAAAGGSRLLVYNPAGERSGPVIGEIEGRRRHALAVVDERGIERPLQILETLSGEAVLLELELERGPGMILLSELVSRELCGLYLQQVRTAVKGTTLEVRLDAAEVDTALDVGRAKAELERTLKNPALEKIRVRASRLPRHRAVVELERLPGHAVTSFPLVRRRAGRGRDFESGPNRLENGLVRLEFEPGGTCLLTDKSSGVSLRCLRFLDVGDRGDTYNFDPVPDDRPICEPERVTLKMLDSGPVAAVAEVRHRFRIPEALHSSRRLRSKRLVPLDLATRVTIHRGSARVDFRTRFLNTARDHRLQAALRLPFELDSILVESAFALCRRPIIALQKPGECQSADTTAALLGREGLYSTSPQKTLAFAERGDLGIALMNRGLAELDAVKLKGATRLALTLVRSVGWLSRPDLEMRTGDAGPSLPCPGAQCLRSFEWNYAIMPLAGEDRLMRALAEAWAFAFPARLVAAPGRGETGIERRGLFELDNPRIMVSATRPLPRGEVEVRLVNYSDRAESFVLRAGEWFGGVREVDLKGEPQTGASAQSTEFGAELLPGRIMTLRLLPAEKK